MSFLDNIKAHLPNRQKEETPEYYFALNIGAERLGVGLWTVEKGRLKILNTASATYKTSEEIVTVTDRLLGEVLADSIIEPDQLLFGVPDSWLQDDNLKENYLKLLRQVVKDLELKPMAYVSTSQALVHFLEKQQSVPVTAVLVGIDKNFVTVMVSRAGKLDGTKVVARGNSLGSDIEKALLGFTNVEVLPSRILLYGSEGVDLDKEKNQLLSFTWMSKLSFLHFPKIEALSDMIDIESICFAGAFELNNDVAYHPETLNKAATAPGMDLLNEKEDAEQPEEKVAAKAGKARLDKTGIGSEEGQAGVAETAAVGSLGFMVGDVAAKTAAKGAAETPEKEEALDDQEFPLEDEQSPVLSDEEFDNFRRTATDEETAILHSSSNLPVAPSDTMDMEIEDSPFSRFKLPGFIPPGLLNIFRNGKTVWLAAILIGIIALILGYLFVPRANIKVYVEPKTLEKDTQVTADPTITQVDESNKKIPGQIVALDISGSSKGSATGTKQVGDSAKGTVIIYNKSLSPVSYSQGTVLSSSNGLKFTLDSPISATSAAETDSGITFGSAHAQVTAAAIGPDSNLPSGTDLTIGGTPASQVSVKAEGNFSGGTSKTVTVVSLDDQNKLLASLASDLRNQAKDKLQQQSPDQKILAEALNETILKKTFSKNVNDQASDFSLNLAVRYKGTAFKDQDLRQIVSKLVSTDVPADFQLDLAQTETQADVSKLEKDGRLIFLAKFKAKLIPKIDADSIKKAIKGKTPEQAGNILQSYDNVLGSEINITPSLPSSLQRIPFWDNNIKVEVGLK